MDSTVLSILPPLITIAVAAWTKKIIPSLLIGLLIGSYMLNSSAAGFGTAVDYLIKTLADEDNQQVLLFLFLFSGLIKLIKQSGGIEAFSSRAGKSIKSEKGVFLTLWAMIPVTFIDDDFRVIGVGSILNSLAEKNRIAKERLAFMLSNTASPIIELIPIATTFVGFNVAVIHQGLRAAGVAGKHSAYAVWLSAIPLEFFSLAIIPITFLSIFFHFGRKMDKTGEANGELARHKLNDKSGVPLIKPRMINLVGPIFCVISLTFFFFWFFRVDKSDNVSFLSAITHTAPNKAMLVALFISVIASAIFYYFQKYKLKEMTADMISGGNEIIVTLVVLVLAWALASVSQDLGLNDFIQKQVGSSLPAWSIPLTLFIISSTVTYFTGSAWGAAALIMPFAIHLAVSEGLGIPLCAAAVITGGTFGDVTSPLAGLTNMAANVTHADHAAYLKYANPHNFLAAGIAAVLFLIAGVKT